MAIFMGVSLFGVAIFSLWKTHGMVMKADWTLANYHSVLLDLTNLQTLGFTIRETILVLLLVWLVSYPIAYFTARIIKDQRLQIAILLLAIIPFWTSYTTRMISWLPMLGRNGLLNQALMSIGILKEPADVFLYSEPAMIYVMILTYALFCIGPVFFSISRIDQELLDASSNLGAGPLRTFIHVILPLSLPGLMAGSIFVLVLVMGEFATPQIIGGGKLPFTGTAIVQSAGLLQWPMASAYSAVLIVATLIMVVIMLRFADIRRQL